MDVDFPAPLIHSCSLRRVNDPLVVAYASITLNGWRIHNVRITRNPREPILMPIRPLTERCGFCTYPNPVLAKFCNECGRPLPTTANVRRHPDPKGGFRTTLEVAHPVRRDAYDEAVNRLLEMCENPGDPGLTPEDLDYLNHNRFE